MTGAGFGGCTVTLISDDQVNAFIESLGRVYEERFGLRADFYVAEIGDGAGDSVSLLSKFVRESATQQ